MSTGARSAGRATMRSSSAIGQVYVRPPEQRRQRHRPDPDRRGEEYVHEHEPPGKVCTPLQLAEAHLPEQHDEHADAEQEQAMRAVAARSQVAEAEEERDQED